MDPKGGAGPLSPAKLAERARRGEALRANLKRRKASARKIAGESVPDDVMVPATSEPDRTR